jgi:hypothetical protein
LVRMACDGFSSINGTCLYAAAWNTRRVCTVWTLYSMPLYFWYPRLRCIF